MSRPTQIGADAGPSRAPQEVYSDSPSSPNLLGSSPDFGDFGEFASAHNHTQTHDLLGSFEDDSRSSQPSAIAIPLSHQRPAGAEQFDLLGDSDWQDVHSSRRVASHPHNSVGARASQNEPIHVNLPPRPDEMPADYAPPLRSPRRLSQMYSFAGPSSPPQITDAGADIVFHPTHVTSDSALGPHDRFSVNEHSSPSAHSSLFNTFTTTTKLASKWKSVLDQHKRSPPPHHRGLSDSSSPGPSSVTALPIDVSHSTPFATSERLAGVYVPPTGAPGYIPQAVPSRENKSNEIEYAGTSLLGRRESTAAVLTSRLADIIRQQLPSRQRLSGRWSLLFSLDQHGASLATLYRLVDKYAVGHHGAGNLLIVRDGNNHLFGAYINESIAKREGSYYGGGESFLFKANDSGQDLRVFRWTGRNQYFALCESDFVSFGGGSGTYGLVLDSSFTHNSSATCPTFDNDVLSASESLQSQRAIRFDCIGLEVWGTQ